MGGDVLECNWGEPKVGPGGRHDVARDSEVDPV